MFEPILKISKKYKYDYLIIGGSTANSIIDANLLQNKNLIYMITTQFSFEKMVQYLDFITDIHPEISTIILPVEYAVYSRDYGNKTPDINNKKTTIKDLFKLYFSYDTTRKSINKIISFFPNFQDSLNCLNRHNKNLYITDINDKKFCSGIESTENCNTEFDIKNEKFTKENYINIFDKYTYSHLFNQNFREETYTSLTKFKQIIKEKNKKIIFVFPPYHGLVQAQFYNNEKYNEVESIKKWIVDNFPNQKIIDMAFINKYTQEPLETTLNYIDIVHPLGKPGHIFYCALKYYNQFKDKDIYIELNKDNITDTLKWQKERLENYISKNNQYIIDFVNLPYEPEIKYQKKLFIPPNNCSFYLNN